MGGIETPKIEGKLSLRASTTGMIMMDDVKVPKENMLNVKGMKGPFSCLNQALAKSFYYRHDHDG